MKTSEDPQPEQEELLLPLGKMEVATKVEKPGLREPMDESGLPPPINQEDLRASVDRGDADVFGDFDDEPEGMELEQTSPVDLDNLEL